MKKQTAYWEKLVIHVCDKRVVHNEKLEKSKGKKHIFLIVWKTLIGSS